MRALFLSTVILSVLALLAPAAQAAPRTVASCDAARIDKAAGVARTLSDCGRVDLRRGAEGAARQALGRLSGALRVRTGDLSLMRSTTTAAGPRLRFQQYVGGVPVRDGQVAVALGKDGAVQHVASSASPSTRLDTKARVSRAEALLTARRRVPSGFDTVVAPTTTLVGEPTASGGLQLAWHVVLATRSPRADWNVLVSARSGEVLKADDQITRVDGSALTYSPNPVQSTGNTGLRDVADSDQAALTNARQSLVLTDLAAGTTLIRGAFADVSTPGTVAGCSLPYNPGQASSATRTYNFTRADDRFEEAAAYLAVTRTRRTFAALGFPGIFPGPVPIDVHCIPDDNSFFSTADDALHMGDGGVDDAEDSDVTIHELGHATQAAQVPGFGPGGPDTEQRAMGEGFGDFLATYIYLQDGDATYQATRRFCVMEWDATSYDPVVGATDGSGCLRWADGTDEGDGSDIGAYGGTPGEEHDDGRYWSAMLTCVFEGIEPSLGTTPARNRMLELVLAHHENLVPTAADTAFADSLQSLRVEDDVRFEGDEIARINTCGQQRLGKAAPADTTAPVVSGALVPGAPDGTNGWYRTPPAVTWTISEPDSARVVTGCQRGAAPGDTPGRTIGCTVTSAGGATSRSLSYRSDQTPPTLAATLSNAAPTVGDAVTATPNASDATSGVAAQSCAAGDTSSAGVKTVVCSATDAAGNVGSQTLTYVVQSKPGGSVPDVTDFTFTKVRVARNGNLSFRLTPDRSIRVKVGAKAGKVKYRGANKRLPKGKAIKFTLKPSSRKARAAMLKKLRGGKRVKVKVTIKPVGEKAVTKTLRVRRR